MALLKSISGILKTKTITHSSVTVLGTFINGVLGILFFVFLARNLGPENFGAVSIAIVVLTMTADIADLGINTGLINFVSKHVFSNHNEALKFLKLGLTLKLISALAVLILGYIMAPVIAEYFFLKPSLTYFLRMSFIGVGGAMLFSFSTNCLQALQKYKSWAVLNILSNSLRLLMVILLSLILVLSPTNALAAYIIFPYFGFFVSLLLLPKKFLIVKEEKSVLRDFFHYNKWVAVSILVAAISSRLDSFFVTRLLSIEQTGYYSVGVQLSSILPQFTYAIAAVVAPKIANYNNKKDLVVYLKKLQLFILGLAVLGFFLSPAAFFILPFIYGEGYNLSVWPFLILFYAQLIFLISVPSHQTIFYYFSNPKIFVLISVFILGVLLFSNLLLVPAYGITGASFSVLIASIINFVLPAIYVLKRLK